MDKQQFLDKVRGSFFGEAMGDALGWPVEFSAVWPSNPEIRSLDQGRRNPDGTAQFTDDTQMLIAGTEGMLAGLMLPHHPDRLQLDVHVATSFSEWYANPVGGHRAPGGACGLGCRQLADMLRKGSTNFTEAGKLGGRGCGAAMRSAFYGWFFINDAKAATAVAARHALMTHRSSSAQASAAATAMATRSAIIGKKPWDIAFDAQMAASIYDERCGRLLAEAMNFATYEGQKHFSEDQVFDRYRGWKGDEAVAGALYAFLRYPDDVEAALCLAVNTPGDSDSFGAITGAIQGAYLGFDAVQDMVPDWVKQVERADYLTRLSETVADWASGSLPEDARNFI